VVRRLETKTVVAMLLSFLFTVMFWDTFLRDYYFSLIGDEVSFLDVGLGYSILVPIFFGLFLFLNKRFSPEESSESQY